jgi:hypothetical protein
LAHESQFKVWEKNGKIAIYDRWLRIDVIKERNFFLETCLKIFDFHCQESAWILKFIIESEPELADDLNVEFPIQFDLDQLENELTELFSEDKLKSYFTLNGELVGLFDSNCSKASVISVSPGLCLNSIKIQEPKVTNLQPNAVSTQDFMHMVPKPLVVVAKVNGHAVHALLDSGSLGFH